MAHVPNSAEQYEKMIGTPIPQLVSSLAIPTTISMLVTIIYNTADTYFVSQINKSASAAVGMVYTLMAILQAVGYGLGMGAGSLISRKLGEKDDDAAERYAVSAFVAAILAGAVVGWGCLAGLKPILRALKCTDTMLPYAVPYARWILLVAPVSCASFVLNNTLRAEGESTLAMWGLGLGGVLNIVLDPLFIFTLDMGAGGAALATAVSQVVSFVLLLLFFLTGRSIVRLRLRIVSRHFCDYWLIFSTGLPTVCRQATVVLKFGDHERMSIATGNGPVDAAVSAITIANKLYVFVRNLVIGIGQGFQPVAGYNYSARKRRRAWQAFWFSSLIGTVLCTVCAIVMAIFARQILCWFCSDAEVVRIGAETLRFSCIVLPLLAVSTFVNQLYQCLGYRTAATFLASCRQGIFFLPAVLLLPLWLHCAGVEMSQPVADLLTFVISMPFLAAFYRHHIRGHAE